MRKIGMTDPKQVQNLARQVPLDFLRLKSNLLWLDALGSITFMTFCDSPIPAALCSHLSWKYMSEVLWTSETEERNPPSEIEVKTTLYPVLVRSGPMMTVATLINTE